MSTIADLEQKAFQIIMEIGSEGILQSELWKQLDSTGREISRIAIRLEKKGLIERERELFNGRWTYRIFSKRNPVTIDSIIDIPCVMCEDISKCGEGSVETIIYCDKIGSWLLTALNSACDEMTREEASKEITKILGGE